MGGLDVVCFVCINDLKAFWLIPTKYGRFDSNANLVQPYLQQQNVADQQGQTVVNDFHNAAEFI